MLIDKSNKTWYNNNHVSSHMTLLKALTNEAQFSIESYEIRIQHLRTEATKRLEAAPNDNGDLVTVGRMIFDILSLQDKINQDRHRISSLGK